MMKRTIEDKHEKNNNFGATGNIGAYFTDYCKEHLDEKEYEVIAVGRKKTDFFEKQGIQYINVDLCKAEDFDRLPKEGVVCSRKSCWIIACIYESI